MGLGDVCCGWCGCLFVVGWRGKWWGRWEFERIGEWLVLFLELEYLHYQLSHCLYEYIYTCKYSPAILA